MRLDERARRAAAPIRRQAEQVDTAQILRQVRRDAARRHWSGRTVAAAAVVTAVAVTVTVVALPRSTPPQPEIDAGPIAPAPAPEPMPEPDRDPTPDGASSATAPPGVAGPGVWERAAAATFAGSDTALLHAAAATGDVVVAVGASTDGGVVWRRDVRHAEEPSAWQRVEPQACGDASCALHDIVAVGERLVAAGVSEGSPTVWVSDDEGRTWPRVDIERTGRAQGAATLTALVADDAGRLVAFGVEEVGGAGTRAVVFVSSDGQRWSEAAVEADADDEDTVEVVDAGTTADGRVLAVGHLGDGSVVWQERDAGVWTLRHLSEGDREFGIVTTFATSLERGPDGTLLLTGSAHGNDGQDGRVWRSTDGGVTWQAMPGDLGGPGDQQVTDLFHTDGSLIAVGWTDTSEDEGDVRPAAWMLGADGWRPMDAGRAFDDPGVIRAGVEIDEHSAMAVGTTGGDGYEAARAMEGSDPAVWTYQVDQGQDPAAAPTGREACSAADRGSEPIPRPDLPGPVADMRRAIRAAAVECDFAELASLARDGTRGFTYSYGDAGDPAAFWRRDENRGEQPLLVLTDVLDLPYASVETQFVADRYETVYVWPSAFADDATEADWEAVVDAGLLDPAQAQRMRDEFGGYTGHRVGLTIDGEWVFFVAGD